MFRSGLRTEDVQDLIEDLIHIENFRDKFELASAQKLQIEEIFYETLHELHLTDHEATIILWLRDTFLRQWAHIKHKHDLF